MNNANITLQIAKELTCDVLVVGGGVAGVKAGGARGHRVKQSTQGLLDGWETLPVTTFQNPEQQGAAQCE